MLSWFRAMMPKEEKFFDLFAQHSRVVVEAAEALRSLLHGTGDHEACCRTIVARENEADDITREVLMATRRSFITPFDRSDIKDLIQSMDDAIDQMQKTVKAITLFEQRSFHPRMQEMSDAILAASKLVAEAVPLLSKVGANATRLSVIAEEVIRVEGLADDLHEHGLKELFVAHGKTDAMAYLIGSEILGHLEKIMDRLEDVANEISSIVIENV